MAEGSAPTVATRPLQLATAASPRGPILAQAVDPTPVAGTAVRRQIPEVGAGWFNDHVRICAGGAGKPVSLPRVCRACPTAWRWKSFIQPDGGEGLVKRKGCRREAGSEGSVEQSRDPTNRNRIRGLPGRTSGLATAKSSAIKDRGGRFGGCAVKAVELTSGDLDASLYTLLQILSVSLFERMPLSQALAGHENRCGQSQIDNQLNLLNN